jgi:hypothetical protein
LARSRSSESPAADVEIEYVTEEPEIYEPNFIFFKRIFEAFKVEGLACSKGAKLNREQWDGLRVRAMFQLNIRIGVGAQSTGVSMWCVSLAHR